MPSCGGCRTCEIACSFHHTGEFRPSASSIRIMTKPDGYGFRIVLLEKDDGESKACNFCTDLAVPMCVDYCKEDQILSGFLRNLRDTAKG